MSWKCGMFARNTYQSLRLRAVRGVGTGAVGRAQAAMHAVPPGAVPGRERSCTPPWGGSLTSQTQEN